MVDLCNLYRQELLKKLDNVLRDEDLFQLRFFRLGGILSLNQMAESRTELNKSTGKQEVVVTTRVENTFFSCADVVFTELQLLFGICEKVDFFVDLKNKGQLEKIQFQLFVQSEINNFHFQLRSLYDSVAKLLSPICLKPGQIPDSFHSLQTWDQKSLETKLGLELSKLVRNCYWFEHFRDTRDSIAHYGRNVRIVHFLIANQIGFNTRLAKGTKTVIETFPQFMTPGSWILFNPYSGFHLGMILQLLDDISWVATERLGIDIPPDIRVTLKGHENVVANMRDARRRLWFADSSLAVFEEGWAIMEASKEFRRLNPK